VFKSASFSFSKTIKKQTKENPSKEENEGSLKRRHFYWGPFVCSFTISQLFGWFVRSFDQRVLTPQISNRMLQRSSLQLKGFEGSQLVFSPRESAFVHFFPFILLLFLQFKNSLFCTDVDMVFLCVLILEERFHINLTF